MNNFKVVIILLAITIAISGSTLYFASKRDVPKGIAKEEDLKDLATSQDLKDLATSQDLKVLNSLNEKFENRLTTLRENLRSAQARLGTVKENLSVLKSKHESAKSKLDSALDNLEEKRSQLSTYQKIIESPKLFLALPNVEEFERSELWSAEMTAFTNQPTERLEMDPRLLEAYGFGSAVRKEYTKEIGEWARLEITLASFSEEDGTKEIYSTVKKEAMEEINYSPDLADESFGTYFSRTYEGGEYTYTRDSIVFRKNSTLVTVRIGTSQIEKKDALPFAELVNNKLSKIL